MPPAVPHMNPQIITDKGNSSAFSITSPSTALGRKKADGELVFNFVQLQTLIPGSPSGRGTGF